MKNMAVFLLLFITIVALSSAASPETIRPGEGPDVITLNDTNFASQVLSDNAPWMVHFYAPWSGHCKQLAPTFAKVAHTFHHKVKFGAYEAVTLPKEFADKFKVRGHPTLIFFPPGKDKQEVRYDGPRDMKEMTVWIKRQLVEYREGKYKEQREQEL